MQIIEATAKPELAPIWRLAFRAGFLLAATFAVVAMARWLGWMYFPARWDMALSPQWWHAHEMLFGFAMPVVAGFLLSAVATWTGLPGTRGNPLKLLFSCWLLARLLLWFTPQWTWAAWLAEMAFFALLLKELGVRVWAKRQWRNILFLPVLLALAGLNSGSYYWAQESLVSTQLHYGALWMMLVLIVIVGGRVIPLFTGNRLGFKINALPAWFEYTAIGSTALLAAAFALSPPLQAHPLLRILCALCALIHSYRLIRWQGWQTLAVPLLWSMHLSYLCIVLTLLGVAVMGDNPAAMKNLLHLLAIGAIGGMILSMMARVSLGHTGRPLEPPSVIGFGFALIAIAAAVRVAIPLWLPEWTLQAWKLSALLWAIAFAIFVVCYLPSLTRARVDGKDG